MKNKEITNSLKCFAILAVCANHFINEYISRNLTGYANGFIAVFFVLSGYGIFLSLEKLDNNSLLHLSLTFFKKRVLRIYPLFWLWCFLHSFSNGILGFFALDFIHPKSPWFIPAILQCYILSIPIYILCKRVKNTYQFGFFFSVFLILNGLLFWKDFSPVQAIGYKGLFFLHIFQFYLGFVLAQMKNRSTTFDNRYISIISIIIFIFLINENTPQKILNFQEITFLFPILLSFSTLFLCFTFLRSKLNFNFKAINFIGTYTYSIYLFHGTSFTFLSKLGIIQKDQTGLTGALIWVLTLPFFILIFAAIETALNEIIFGKCSPKNAMRSYLKSMKISA